MRITFLTQYMSKRSGGVIEVVESLYKQLEKAGTHCFVLGVDDSVAATHEKLHYNQNFLSYSIVGPRSFGFGIRVVPMLFSTRAEIIHTHGLWMFYSLVALTFSKLFTVPVIVSPHGMLDAWALRNSVWKKKMVSCAWERSLLNHAKCVHALNVEEAKAIREWGCTAPIAIVPNGVDLPDHTKNYDTPLWRSALPSDSKVMLFLGRLHPKKGLIPLIQAWSHFARINKTWHLVVAGWDDRGFASELSILIRSLGLTDSVHLIGPVFGDDKAACYANADSFILPSFSEGLPMAVLEAWAWKIPVLMTRQCNLSKSFEVNAAYEIHSDVDSLVCELNKYVTNFEEIKTEIAENGYRLAVSNYTWEAVAMQFREIYDWILGKINSPKNVVLYDD